MVYEGKKSWPGMKAGNALDMLKRLNGYDLIITGDNHKQFTVEYNGRWLINPGSPVSCL